MRVERFEQAHQLADGQLITDAAGYLWKIHKYDTGGAAGETWLMHFSDEYAFWVRPSGETHALGNDAPLPWTTVKVVPDADGHLDAMMREQERLSLARVRRLADRVPDATGLMFDLEDIRSVLSCLDRLLNHDDLPRPVLDPCPVCGFADWPEGGMHAARSIHLRAHERAGESPTCQTQRLLFASPPHGPTCTLPVNHDGGCVWPETWVDPKTGKTVDVANHGRVTADRRRVE